LATRALSIARISGSSGEILIFDLDDGIESFISAACEAVPAARHKNRSAILFMIFLVFLEVSKNSKTCGFKKP
jgi:hypothetical protein